MEEKKKLEIVSGNGSDLNISPAYDHLKFAKPKSANQKPTGIVIPKKSSKKSKNKKDDKKDLKKEEN